MDNKEAEELEELIQKIARKVNEENLLTQIAEESAELTQAALKCRRARQTAAKLKRISPTPVIVKEAYKNLEEEIADVELSICVLGETHSPATIMLDKARRWLERLEAYDKGGGDALTRVCAARDAAYPPPVRFDRRTVRKTVNTEEGY